VRTTLFQPSNARGHRHIDGFAFRRDAAGNEVDLEGDAIVDRQHENPYSPAMTATQIIHEIDCLPPTDVEKIVTHANERLEELRQLSPAALGVLLDQFIEATDPNQVERLRLELTQGFYGR
jgi:hypothetical protein